MNRSIAKPRIRPALRTGVFAVGAMWIASVACGQGAIDPRADTRTQIIAPKYLPGYDPFNPTGFDDPTAELLGDPPGGPMPPFAPIDPAAFDSVSSGFEFAGASSEPAPVPAPGPVAAFVLSASAVFLPRRRSR